MDRATPPTPPTFTAYDPPSRPISGRTILQIVPDLQSGGAERSSVDVAEALALAGARSLVVSRGGRMVSELQSKGGVWIPFPAATKNPLSMAFNVLRLARIIRDEGVDIVHARSRAPAWVAYYAARRAGAHFMTTYHSIYSGASPIKHRYNGIMAAGEAVIANSRYTARRIAQIYPEAIGRIVVIARGVDPRLFTPAAVDPRRVERLRAAWSVAPHQRIVLLPARLAPRKGHAVLIEAAKRLAETGRKDVRFIFVGDAPSEAFRRALETQIARDRLTDVVRYAGYCPDMPAAYLAAAAIVAPATEPEAFGRVAAEAQAMGAPIIVSDIGAAPEVVLAPPEAPLEQATGWRFPVGDPGALARQIGETLDMTASARDALSLRAREHVAGRYSIERMCAATLDVYERLLDVAASTKNYG
jgi:glycosyltransferase involved in cell wall biosynthesis